MRVNPYCCVNKGNYMNKLFKNIKQKIIAYINDLDYKMWVIKIMSDAIEYGEEPEVVEYFLENNYKNHYG